MQNKISTLWSGDRYGLPTFAQKEENEIAKAQKWIG